MDAPSLDRQLELQIKYACYGLKRLKFGENVEEWGHLWVCIPCSLSGPWLWLLIFRSITHLRYDQFPRASPLRTLRLTRGGMQHETMATNMSCLSQFLRKILWCCPIRTRSENLPLEAIISLSVTMGYLAERLLKWEMDLQEFLVIFTPL